MIELITVNLGIVVDFALGPVTFDESRDVYQRFIGQRFIERNG
jgi:hypothetical protein